MANILILPRFKEQDEIFEGIENEKDFKRTDIPESEDNAITAFNDKISEFVNNHKDSTWSINTDLYTLLKNVTDKKAAQRWCILNDISNYDGLKNYVVQRIKREKYRAENEATEEKINKINEENALKVYSREEINKALEGVLALMTNKQKLSEQLRELTKKENDARERYHKMLVNHDESRHEVWDEVLAYRRQEEKLAEERDNFEKTLDTYMDPIAYYYLKEFKYKKDENIDKCETINDIENLIKSKDWYSEEGKGRLKLGNMNVRAAKNIFKCMERIFAIFPEQKGSNVSLVCEPPLGKNCWAYAIGGKISFVPKYYAGEAYEELEKDCNKNTSGGWHPKGTGAEDIPYHEYYHVMTAGGRRGYSLAKKIKEKVTKRLKMRGKKGGPKQDDIIKFGVSEYATVNADEFGAECFEQALGAENPSAFAVEVFKETLKYKKYMRGMV